VQLGVQSWMFEHITDICEEDQPQKFTCANTQVFASASTIWGVVGPALQFSDGIYSSLLYFLLIGAVCPVIVWALQKRYPSSWIAYINFPILFGGTFLLPPATAVNFVPWVIVGFVFQYIIRRRHFPFWAKYNYILSAALDAGTAISTILIYFCLQFPKNGTIGANNIQAWWGNVVHKQTVDYSGTPQSSQTVAPFGPAPGSW